MPPVRMGCMDAELPNDDLRSATVKRRLYWNQFSLRTFLIVMTITPLLLWACDHSISTIEDGWLDVEMRYQIVDAETGLPIPGATVDFIDDEITSGHLQKVTASIMTGADGVAARICHDSGCSWHTSALG